MHYVITTEPRHAVITTLGEWKSLGCCAATAGERESVKAPLSGALPNEHGAVIREYINNFGVINFGMMLSLFATAPS